MEVSELNGIVRFIVRSVCKQFCSCKCAFKIWIRCSLIIWHFNKNFDQQIQSIRALVYKSSRCGPVLLCFAKHKFIITFVLSLGAHKVFLCFPPFFRLPACPRRQNCLILIFNLMLDDICLKFWPFFVSPRILSIYPPRLVTSGSDSSRMLK